MGGWWLSLSEAPSFPGFGWGLAEAPPRATPCPKIAKGHLAYRSRSTNARGEPMGFQKVENAHKYVQTAQTLVPFPNACYNRICLV